MKRPASTRLAYLMDQFSIKGKELARSLSIDESLISRWRRGGRVLRSDSPYFAAIVDRVLQEDRTRPVSRLVPFLLRQMPGQDAAFLQDPKNLRDALSYWLAHDGLETDPMEWAMAVDQGLEEVPPGVTHSARILIDTGNEGRRKAVLRLLAAVHRSPTPVRLRIVSQERMDWLTEDPAFLNTWREQMAMILLRHPVTVLHTVDRSPESLSSVLRQWLPLYFTGNLTACLLPRDPQSPVRVSLVLAEELLSLSAMSGSAENGRKSRRSGEAPPQADSAGVTVTSSDPILVHQHCAVFDQWTRSAIPLFDVFRCPLPPDRAALSRAATRRGRGRPSLSDYFTTCPVTHAILDLATAESGLLEQLMPREAWFDVSRRSGRQDPRRDALLSFLESAPETSRFGLLRARDIEGPTGYNLVLADQTVLAFPAYASEGKGVVLCVREPTFVAIVTDWFHRLEQRNPPLDDRQALVRRLRRLD